MVRQDPGGDTHVVVIAVDLRTVAEQTTYDGMYVLDARGWPTQHNHFVGAAKRDDNGG